jgi:hypothetical protein
MNRNAKRIEPRPAYLIPTLERGNQISQNRVFRLYFVSSRQFTYDLFALGLLTSEEVFGEDADFP